MTLIISILFFILNIKIISNDEFNIIRGKRVHSGLDDYHKNSTVLCITDTIEDAIVWNTYLNWSTNSKFKYKDRINLQTVPQLSYGGISETKRKCDINAGSSNCFISFTQQSNDWNLEFTSEVPMGPVFDSRWEFPVFQ
ncbi:hypothetical protein PV327_011652, partial [Microctonus hyperodae]